MKKILLAIVTVFISFAIPLTGILFGKLQNFLSEKELMLGILFALVYLSAMTTVVALNIKELIEK